MPHNIRSHTPEGAPMRPLAQYQSAIRAVCSSRFHHAEVYVVVSVYEKTRKIEWKPTIKTKPGFKQLSNTPRKKRPIASPVNELAAPVAAKVAPLFELATWIYGCDARHCSIS